MPDMRTIPIPKDIATDSEGGQAYFTFNASMYWCCKSCSEEYEVLEVPKASDGICSACKSYWQDSAPEQEFKRLKIYLLTSSRSMLVY